MTANKIRKVRSLSTSDASLMYPKNVLRVWCCLKCFEGANCLVLVLAGKVGVYEPAAEKKKQTNKME